MITNVNIPTILTYIRIILIPAIVIAFYLPGKFAHELAAGIFALAALTDTLDGYLARNLNQITKFGEFLDPVADKLIVAVVLILLVGELGAVYLTIPAAVIIGREITISALREWMAEIGNRGHVAVGLLGKIKTSVQMAALVLLLLYYPKLPTDKWLLWLGIMLLYFAASLTLWSMFKYLQAAWLDFK